MPTQFGYTRRDWLAAVASGGAGALLASCSTANNAPAAITPERGSGRLSTVFKKPTGTTATGFAALNIDQSRDGLRYVPAGYSAGVAAPLVLMLHGAGGSPTGALAPFQALADAAGFILLAPFSRDFSWDVRFGSFGPDVTFIDKALEQTFSKCNVDASRIFVEGFSDGASYALSLGLSNGDLFKKIVAFSPGFSSPGEVQGKPRIFVSHGVADEVLNINSTSRVLVPRLRTDGYDVTYQEFTGPHAVPTEIAVQAKDWLLAP